MCRLSRSTLAAECLPRKPAPAFEHFTASRLLLQLKRADVPLELEEIGLPMNTFGPKNPFIGESAVWRRTVLNPAQPATRAPAQRSQSHPGSWLGSLLTMLNCSSPLPPPAGKIVSVETITGPKATGETCHIIIQVRAINYRLL